jgi:hypothetical protein
MQRNQKRTIPDLRKKSDNPSYINYKNINIGSCIFIGIIIIFLILSLINVAAMPNSNFPANI